METDATFELSPMRSARRLMRHRSQRWHPSVMPSCPYLSLALRSVTTAWVESLKDQDAGAWWQIEGVGPRHEPTSDDSHRENPTFHPTDQTDITGPNRHHWTKPTPPDHSNRRHPPRDPSVV